MFVELAVAETEPGFKGDTVQGSTKPATLETGLEIRRIRYVASQPWPYSQTSIAGFYVEADSRKPLRIQEDELSELVWVKREDLPPRKNLTSITDNLIEWFRHGKTVDEIRKELE